MPARLRERLAEVHERFHIGRLRAHHGVERVGRLAPLRAREMLHAEREMRRSESGLQRDRAAIFGKRRVRGAERFVGEPRGEARGRASRVGLGGAPRGVERERRLPGLQLAKRLRDERRRPGIAHGLAERR